MPRFLFNLLAFVLGVLLAFVLTFRGELAQLALDTFQSVRVRYTANDPSPIEQAARARLESKRRFEQKSREPRSVPVEERREILTRAVEEGSLESLQVIRTEYLSFLPEYRTSLLPILKVAALKTLERRFSDADWADWPSSAIGKEGGPTSARVFVDDVMLVNAELGRYLETAAQLFHGMYLSIMSGNPYNIEEDLYYIIHNAEKVLSFRHSPAVPARLQLEPTILDDPIFHDHVGTLEETLILSFFEAYPDNLKAHLRIIEGLEPGPAGSPLNEGVRTLLYRLSLDASSSFRAETAAFVAQSRVLAEFAAADEGVRRALAELYVILAVDAIEIADRETASEMVSHSQRIFPGLASQQAVRQFLKESSAEKQRAEEVDEESAESAGGLGLGDYVRRGAGAAAGGAGTVIVWLAIALAVLLVAAKLFLGYLARKSTHVTGAKGTAFEGDAADDEMPELAFDDLDDILEQNIINS